MKKFQRSALALVLSLCSLLGLTACGTQAPAETAAAPTEITAPATTAPAETAPSETEIITELMENYLSQQVFGVEIFRDYGVSMEHSGEPVQSWAVYLTDEEGHCLRSTYHPVVKDQPQLESQDPDALTPAEAIRAFRDGLKAGEIGRGQFFDYLVNDPHGYYCFLSLDEPDQPPVLYGTAFLDFAWSHPFCWLQQETQQEHLQKVLEDPARTAEFFALSEETYRDQNCLCVSYEMDSAMVRVLDPYSFEKMFPTWDNEYIQSRNVQPVLRPGTPVSVKAYFDPETGVCLGEIMDASAAAARLMDMMTTIPNVTEGSRSFTTEKFYLREPLENIPELEGFQLGQREDLHRIDLNYGRAISGETPPVSVQSTYELILDPIVQMFSIRENGKEIALLCPYLYFGMDPWDQYELQNEFIEAQEMVENPQYDIEINRVSMAEVFHYPTLGDQVGYVARVRLKNHKHGAEVFAWDRDTAVNVAQSLVIQ